MRKFLIKKLGGFTDTDDFIKEIRSLNSEDKYRILTIAVKRLFNTIGQDDVLQQIDGEWRFEGKPITKGEIDNIRMQAKSFMDSKLWSVLEKELKYQANRQMFSEAKTWEDLMSGKVLLLLVHIIKVRLKNI